MAIALRLESFKKHLFVGLLTGLALVSGMSTVSAQTATASRAATAVTGADLLPESTHFFYSCPDVTAAKKRFGNSTIGQLWADKKMEPFLDEVYSLVKEKIGDNVEEALELSLEDLAGMMSGEATIAVSSVGREVAVVLLVDVGDNKETLSKVLGKLDEALKGTGADQSEETAGDVKLQVFTLPQNPAFKKLAYFVHGSRFVFCTDATLSKTMAGRLTGKSSGKTFAKSETYAAVCKECRVDARPGVFEFYYDPVGAVKAIAMKVPQMAFVTGYIPVLGLDQFRGIGGSMDVDCEKYEMFSRQILFNDRPLDKIAKIFHFVEGDQTPPDWVPANAGGYYSLKWDLKGATDAVEELVDSFAGPGAFQKFLDQAADEGDGPGIHVRKDLLDQLDGRIVVTTFPAKNEDGDESIGYLVAATLVDGDAVAKTLARTTKESDSVETIEHKGKKIYSVQDLPNEAECFMTVVGKNLVASTSLDSVKGMIDGKKPEQKLADSATYKSLMSGLPGKMNVLGVDLGGASSRMTWNSMRNGEYDSENQLDIDWSKLPEFEDVKGYFNSSIMFTVPCEHGCITTGYTLRGSK